MSASLAGRIACVTGATRGVGRSIALALAEAGADLVIVGRDERAAEEVGVLAEGFGRRSWRCIADVAAPDRLAAALEACGVPRDGIGILVCAAGMSLPHAPVGSYDHADYRACFDLNLFGVMQAVQAVLPGMMARRDGRIVAIGGTYGYRGVAGSALYAASKWALRGLIKSVAVEAGPFGVTANIVAPGGIDGEKLRGQFAQSAQREGLSAQQVHDRFAARSAMRQLVREADVAAMVLFAVSDAAARITGQDLLVDGGTII